MCIHVNMHDTEMLYISHTDVIQICYICYMSHTYFIWLFCKRDIWHICITQIHLSDMLHVTYMSQEIHLWCTWWCCSVPRCVAVCHGIITDETYLTLIQRCFYIHVTWDAWCLYLSYTCDTDMLHVTYISHEIHLWCRWWCETHLICDVVSLIHRCLYRWYMYTYTICTHIRYVLWYSVLDTSLMLCLWYRYVYVSLMRRCFYIHVTWDTSLMMCLWYRYVFVSLIQICLYRWYMYTYTNVCIYTHIHIYTYKHIHIYPRDIFDVDLWYTSVCFQSIFRYTYICVFIYMHIYMYICSTNARLWAAQTCICAYI